MSQWLDADEHRTWRTYLRMHAQLIAALAQALKADSDMSLADYEVLAVLSESPDGALRARELRSELQWDKSRLAHQARRMEQRGLVSRETCAEDARGSVVHITESGAAAIRAAAPDHVERVRALFLAALSPAQVQGMGEVADAVLANLAASEFSDNATNRGGSGDAAMDEVVHGSH